MVIIKAMFRVLFLFFFLPGARGQFHAIHIPESQLAKMKIDGDSSDWNWIPRERYTSRVSMFDYLTGPWVGIDSLNCSFAVGWSEITNKVYIQGIVHDKKRGPDAIRVNPHWWFCDGMEYMSNPLNNIGEGHALKYEFFFPLADKPDSINVEIGAAWIRESNTDVQFAGRLWKAKDGSYVAVYEIAVSLWDRWDKRGRVFSKRHQLTAGEQFPLGIWFDNDTYQTQELLSQWSTNRTQQAYLNPYELSRFVMDAPVGKEEAWAGIDRVLRP